MSRTDRPASRRPCRLLLGGLLLLALPLGPGGGARAQGPAPDPVAELRQALRAMPADPEARDRQTKHCLEALHSLPDCQRALILAEWRDDYPDPALAAVDRANRAVVAERFTEGARAALRGGDRAAVAGALDLLTGLAKVARARGEPPSLAGRLAPELARLTRQGPPAVRAAAARTLGQVGPEVSVAVPALADLLREKDTGLRLAAAEGLAGLLRPAAPDTADVPGGGPPEGRGTGDTVRVAAGVLSALGPGLGDASAEVRRCSVGAVALAAAALSRLAADRCPTEAEEPPAEPDLRRANAGGWAALRPFALALGRQGPALARALGDGDVEVRLGAQKAVAELGLARRYWLRGRPGPEDDPLREALSAAVPGLADATAHPEARVRRSAVDVLEVLGSVAAPAATALAHALNDPDRFVRWSAARTLGGLGPPAARWARPGLERLLNDPDPDVRQAAAAALERLNRPGPESPVHQAAHSGPGR
jgi:HEAT repeat protein